MAGARLISSAKVQSALLEAMQERQVTIGTSTFALPRPFLVLATQNPIEQEGTYPLPEAQVDRFMLKLKLDYPSLEEEREIVERVLSGATQQMLTAVGIERLDAARSAMRLIHMEEKLAGYIVRIVDATRHPEAYGLKLKHLIGFGASPRGSIWLNQAARASAFLKGRGYVTPQDVKALAPDVLRHRILLTYEAEADGITTDNVIASILEAVEVP
ncbi:MAG: ATPase family associated with various cellular activities (AAA) [Deltaproteobacteria bacterium ADurb.Bin510]|nr:MAG: ATPase family associated with various cellular activities (AAA) [Deltaproteobacteria bacterium ADurb.Bin510]